LTENQQTLVIFVYLQVLNFLLKFNNYLKTKSTKICTFAKHLIQIKIKQ